MAAEPPPPVIVPVSRYDIGSTSENSLIIPDSAEASTRKRRIAFERERAGRARPGPAGCRHVRILCRRIGGDCWKVEISADLVGQHRIARARAERELILLRCSGVVVEQPTES